MLKRLRERLRRAIRRRDRQTEMIRRTGGRVRGHHRARKEAVETIRRLRKRIGATDPGQLSAHFHVREFACKNGRPVPRAAYPALRHLCVTYLEPLRAQFGAVHVTSGYRPRDYNARIGGASESLHIYDYPGRNCNAVAADVVCATGTPQQWAAFLERLNPGGLCPYPQSGFVHVDNRQRVGMSPARWGA